MEIAEIVPLIVPIASAVAILIPTFGNRRAILKRLDVLERIVQMLVMHDEHLPYSERLNGGKRCIDLGGNGSVLAYYEELKKKYQDRVKQGMGEGI